MEGGSGGGNLFEGAAERARQALESVAAPAKEIAEGVGQVLDDDDFVPDGFVCAAHILFLHAPDAEVSVACM